MEWFVSEGSIVRKIWGKSDTILFIFAGAAAEFALNKAVDWLYFTGRLPADPIGRLFSTVAYARQIIFSEREEAYNAIDKIASIHAGIEKARGASIPDWAYRDVLFMLMHYSIASFELLERKMKAGEKQELFDVFHRVGIRLGLKELPPNYQAWLPVREEHMNSNLLYTAFTADLFRQYKKHLGTASFVVLKEAQLLVVPPRVKELLRLQRMSRLFPFVPFYKLSRLVKADRFIKWLLLPSAYKRQIQELDAVS